MANQSGDYGSFGSVGTVEPQGNLRPVDVHTNSEMFGAPVARGVKGIGQTVEQIGLDQMTLAARMMEEESETRVNDEFANKFYPAAAELRVQYETAEDPNTAYPEYLDGLKSLNSEFMGGAQSPYEQRLMRGLLNQHTQTETRWASGLLATSKKDNAYQAMADRIMVASDSAAENYADDNYAIQAHTVTEGLLTTRALDDGLDLNDPAQRGALKDINREARADIGLARMNGAFKNQDYAAANRLRAEYAKDIPMHQRQVLDDTLDMANIKEYREKSAQALMSGGGVYQVASPPEVVQAVVADAAISRGVDPNLALSILHIESRNGQNMGKSGTSRPTIGQTSEKAATLGGQADDMLGYLVEAKKNAQNMTGMEDPPDWLVYLNYQQGAGGGPALYKAAQASATTKAVDALIPLYKKASSAYSAVTGNGGAKDTTAREFLDYWKKNYEKNAEKASIEIPDYKKTDNFDHLKTVLNEDDERAFQDWKLKNKPDDDGRDYDLRGAWQAGLTVDENGHMADTYKLPNHETFSNQSVHAEKHPALAGSWDENGIYLPPPSIGERIIEPTMGGHAPVSKAVTPRSQLNAFDERYPDMMARANRIVNPNSRRQVISRIQNERGNLASVSSAYTGKLINQAQRMALDPEFTDIDKVPPDVMATLLSDSPATVQYLEARAASNMKKKMGSLDEISENKLKNGALIYDVYRQLGETINTEEQLMDYIFGSGKPQAGGLTLAGQAAASTRLKAIQSGKGGSSGGNFSTPAARQADIDRIKGDLTLEETQSLYESGDLNHSEYEFLAKTFKEVQKNPDLAAQKKATYDAIRHKYLNYNKTFKEFRRPNHSEVWAKMMPYLDKWIVDHSEQGASMIDMNDPKSPHFIENAITQFKQTPDVIARQIMDAKEYDFNTWSDAATRVFHGEDLTSKHGVIQAYRNYSKYGDDPERLKGLRNKMLSLMTVEEQAQAYATDKTLQVPTYGGDGIAIEEARAIVGRKIKNAKTPEERAALIKFAREKGLMRKTVSETEAIPQPTPAEQ